MCGLVPNQNGAESADDSGANVISISEQASDDVFEALASETTRDVLDALYDQPGTASDLASRVDTSVQNIQYHLQKLKEAGLIEIIDTWYSKQNKEMKVYAPASESLVVFAGTEQTTPTLRKALSRLLSVLGVIAVGSIVINRVITLTPTTTFDSYQPHPIIGVIPSLLVTPGVIFFTGGIVSLLMTIILFNNQLRNFSIN